MQTIISYLLTALALGLTLKFFRAYFLAKFNLHIADKWWATFILPFAIAAVTILAPKLKMLLGCS
ncbi:hypothetical protein [Pseudomonas sp. BP8]|uniref:hypothetical protein n=1 Tax=Pseudomonas sp. BP8 TaxID=2817864 RepID=UPI001AE21AA3|nr:hypothetical protein [Pseudomonas sp. BP8]MBP2262195.1 hypothetical protein [Pseudomonas sp. BP8]HDS1733122.1 hypothetical protein [Pseudomonas putida]